MPQMRPALAAHDFNAVHAVAHVFFGLDGFLVDRFKKARPTGSRFVLSIRIEQLVAACGTFVDAGLFRFVVLAREGRLRAFHSAHLVLLGRKLLLPLFLGLFNFFFHAAIVPPFAGDRWLFAECGSRDTTAPGYICVGRT
jgi:hypothetical protein